MERMWRMLTDQRVRNLKSGPMSKAGLYRSYLCGAAALAGADAHCLCLKTEIDMETIVRAIDVGFW